MSDDAYALRRDARTARVEAREAAAPGRHEALERRGAAARLGYAQMLSSRAAGPAPVQRKSNRTGLPDRLKSGLEALSGHAFDDVRVHYASSQPAQLNAHAFARGRDIHLGPGQDRHLPHEAWHLVQQAQGRVAPTARTVGGVALNDDPGLEREADRMGARAASDPAGGAVGRPAAAAAGASQPAQLSALSRLLPLCSGGGRTVVQRVKVDVGSGEKEVADLSEQEMEALMRLQPMLTEALEADIVSWIEKKSFSHVRDLYFRNQLARWKQPAAESAPKKAKKKRRPKGEKVVIDDMFSDEDSELSDAEADFDKWHERKPFGTTAAINRSHVPTAEDELGEDVHVTGMHHADTFLIVKQGGQFVPRTINAKPNVKAHRKVLPEDKLLDLAKKRDDEKATTEEREKASDELLASQRQLLFGSAIDWEEDDYDPGLVKDQESHRAELAEDTGPVGALIRRNAMSGLRSGRKDITHTDAEQKLLSSKVWKSMLMKLMASMDEVAMDPLYKGLLAERGIQLLLNRSSCLGCGKALALALVDFWKAVAAVVGFKDWRAARDYYAGLTLFKIAFPVIYEYDTEKKSDFANFKTIMLGLQDAGWTIEAPKGIESNKHAEENHQKLKGLLAESEGAKKKKPEEVEGGEDPLALVRERFEIGEASGEGNNCLLSTLSQLRNNTDEENAEGIETMRETLNEAGLAEEDEMIDLYGGAGMQLANDLGIRIQAIEVVGSTLVTHPILGSGGPLLFILHQGAHFSPLWLP